MSPRGEHLHYVDLVRVLTVGLVIGLHVLALAPFAPGVPIGALIIVFHVSREVFFLLTAFVLTHSTARRPRWPEFWRRRYLFVVVPYLLWTVVYFLADGGPYSVVSFRTELLTGTARYHLYFLLVSMQIYLVWPVIRALIAATRRHHRALAAFAVAYQLVFSLAGQQQWTIGALSGWLRAPDAWLPSYLGYVLAGALAGAHREELVAWTRQHVRVVLGGCLAALALGAGVYLAQVYLGGQPPLVASTVFQPVVAVESFAVAWAFLALGLVWTERGTPWRGLVRATSDASFGVYLIHPLVLQYVLLGVTAAGFTARPVPDAVALPALVLVVVPFVYLVSGLVTAAARRTPASLALTGRARRRRKPARVPELALVQSGGTP
ncbi:acyltransferase [Amycolatopsis thermophila]|uniref:Surface polysaccharide O-acyltransferase-like enzyme n=1 Tax=Amycolatopsis thermophila TaxID=206084 RepID=A0ABU0ELN3_9PSEU|nr:acyltransferase [Amycolatopsis thermophila]MDQ0376184.1 surface polysaccharide O-acyltransferase-like enzyme [Amycolatopsis thermophila]